jgi:hypothetical protein
MIERADLNVLEMDQFKEIKYRDALHLIKSDDENVKLEAEVVAMSNGNCNSVMVKVEEIEQKSDEFEVSVGETITAHVGEIFVRK